MFTMVLAGAKMRGWSGRVAEWADAKDLGFVNHSFSVILFRPVRFRFHP